ncbi:MAG: phenylacetate--CoA ligase, partial [Clostridia bacterium]|nr:phenylacetate--CoA ligase [Clostridia bacterium]
MEYFNPEIECADRETLRAIQSERLKNIVKKCYENVPLYKNRFDEMGLKPEDIQSIDDITKLPFTYKT